MENQRSLASYRIAGDLDTAPRWSPDGQHIAFWFSTFKEEPGLSTHGSQYLGVLDVVSGIVTNYCIPGDYAAQLGGSRKLIPPLWSPDNKQVVVQNRYSENASRVILVDLVQG